MRRSDLLAQLRRYRPADDLEAHHAAIVELVGSAEGAFDRDHFDPGHITASCFIVDGGGALLLHHHRRLNRWLQMGGHVEGDERTHEAALREGAEESGLRDLTLLGDGIFDLDVHVIPAAKGEPEHRHFDVRYVARTAAPHALVLDRNESNDLAWMPLDRAEALMGEAASSRVIQKIRSRL